METTVCKQCGNPFEHVPNKFGRRRICDACITANKKANRKLTGYKISGQSSALTMKPFEHHSREETAKLLNLHIRNLQWIERRVLSKIRNDPELKELFVRWQAEGGGVPARTDPGEQILDYQLEVATFWEVYEGLVTLGASADAIQCLAEIAHCQQMIANGLKTGPI